ncbi:MAG TPA: hypothetical protein VHL34_04760 [Rhizomicrobium sp.]|jgi:hypothetical protein|nr:hypothetical protein [Rhizomicrobium sp.]
MRKLVLGLTLGLAAIPLVAYAAITYGSMASASLGQGASLNGAVPFPADNAWNTDISQAPVDPNSDAILATIAIGNGLHPDFGKGTYAGAIIGIPYYVVAGSQPKVKVKYTWYGDQSDKGPMPIPANALIEGYKPNGKPFSGDRHLLVIDRDDNLLYELYNAKLKDDGTWSAASGAIFHLDSNNVRPTQKNNWTSADAAGLPIFPGLARYDEVAAGVIPHALRFTVENTRKAYIRPANHWASDDTNPNLPPMGMRVRLKASYVIPADFDKQTKVILKALKTYGMMIADNGSNWYISGAPDERWKNDKLVSELREVTRGNFEVVKMGKIYKPK